MISTTHITVYLSVNESILLASRMHRKRYSNTNEYIFIFRNTNFTHNKYLYCLVLLYCPQKLIGGDTTKDINSYISTLNEICNRICELDTINEEVYPFLFDLLIQVSRANRKHRELILKAVNLIK